jgi:hypothetical protein
MPGFETAAPSVDRDMGEAAVDDASSTTPLLTPAQTGRLRDELAEWTHRRSADAARKATSQTRARLVEEMERSMSG